ncbi:MAG: hypothetical protein IJO48_02845, partial [Clostridia bacterium]|nr:hypothetical protein [Clostridia bacterium]
MKKHIALLLAIIMLLSIMPVSAVAEADSFALTQVYEASAEVADYAEQNRALPETVNVGETAVTLAEYTYLAASAIMNTRSGISDDIAYKEVAKAKASANVITAGELA